MSGAGLPCVLRATASFDYVRLHGPDHQHMCAGLHSMQDLHWWTERFREWEAMDKDGFVYFNNDGSGNAVRHATSLSRMLNPNSERRDIVTSVWLKTVPLAPTHLNDYGR
jgi:uncharacterized protein YecE (DUF72 family)